MINISINKPVVFMIQSKCLNNALSKEIINTGDVFANVQKVILLLKKNKFLLIKTCVHKLE